MRHLDGVDDGQCVQLQRSPRAAGIFVMDSHRVEVVRRVEPRLPVLVVDEHLVIRASRSRYPEVFRRADALPMFKW